MPETVKASCPKCGVVYTVPPSAVGKVTACRSCDQRFAVAAQADRPVIAPPAVSPPLVPPPKRRYGFLALLAGLADLLSFLVWGAALAAFVFGVWAMFQAMSRATSAPQEATVAATFAALFVAVYGVARAVEKMTAGPRRRSD